MTHDAYAIREKGTIVFWSRKAGNTSLAEWLLRGHHGADAGERTIPVRRRLASMGQLPVDPVEAIRLVEHEGFEDFVLCRNPFDRIVSTYVEKFVYYGHRPLDSLAKLKQYAGRAVLESTAATARAQEPGAHANRYAGISFMQLLEYIAARVRERRANGGSRLNNHLGTQVPHSFDGRFSYRNVIRLERVSAEIAPLASRLGLEIPFPHARRNEVSARLVNDQDLADVSSVELIRAGIVPGAGALLNARTRSLIRAAYAIDFRMLGYDPGTERPAAVEQENSR